MNKVLWVTSFNRELFYASGQFLLASWIKTKSVGDFYCSYEGFGHDNPLLPDTEGKLKGTLIYVDLAFNDLLEKFFKENVNIIPRELGGNALPCNCRNPYGKKDNDHFRRCRFTWWNRNVYRWFRKFATLGNIPNKLLVKYNYVIWLDSDVMFTNTVDIARADSMLEEYDVCYLKSHRKVLEGGLAGYNLKKNGKNVLNQILDLYLSGDFKRLLRWDDCYVLQKIMQRLNKGKYHDLAERVDYSNYSDVFIGSPLIHGYFVHNKGKHSRGIKLFK